MKVSMKVFALLVLCLNISYIQTRRVQKVNKQCVKMCAINYHPVCAYSKMCNYEAKNKCLMHNYNCRRVENKKTAFKNVRPGVCPIDSKCPPDFER